MESHISKVFQYFDFIQSSFTDQYSFDSFNYNDHHIFQVKIYNYLNPPQYIKADFQITFDHLIDNYYIDSLVVKYDDHNKRSYQYMKSHQYPSSMKNQSYFFYLDSNQINWSQIIKNIKLLTIKYL